MMKKLFSILLIPFLFGCEEIDDKQQDSGHELEIHYLASIEEGLLARIFGFHLDAIKEDLFLINDEIAFKYHNRDEIKNTLVIADSISITEDLSLIFYSYSVKADVAKDVAWFRMVEGKLYLANVWLATYSYEDYKDFQDMTENEVEELSEKISNWEESSSNVWWSN